MKNENNLTEWKTKKGEKSKGFTKYKVSKLKESNRTDVYESIYRKSSEEEPIW